jgi:tripartite-type tricarboxylate transporter receptor subunit TctC
MTDLIGGQVQVMFADVATSLPHIKSGALRALAVTTASPLEMLPGVPTIDATVTGYEASAWFGFAAPKGTSREIVDKLNIAINASLTDLKLAARLSDLGAVPIVLGTADFYAFVAAETAKWAKAVEAAGVRGD